MSRDTTAPESLRELGPYTLTTALGRGGMGTVFHGRDRATGREVAVKVLAPAFATEEGFRTRFESEIQSLKKLRHPNIVALYGYGEQDGHLFYAMELVKGGSLHDELAAGRRFEWREVVQIGISICAALKHAHDHGVIHRDIKPANLLLVEDEQQIKLTDFGIAKLFGQTSLTVAGGIVGTADYMAPEQAQGLPVTPRTDLYSVGCVMYALLTGRPPFDGTSVATVIHKVQFDAPIPVGRIVPNIPEALESLIERLLEKDPRQRIHTAMAVAKRLEAIQSQVQIERPTPTGEIPSGDAELTLDQPAADVAQAEGPLPEGAADNDTPTVEMSREQFLSGGVADPHASETLAENDPAASVAATGRPAKTFVAVEDETAADPRSSGWMGAVSLSLLCIICIGLLVWAIARLIAPPSADELFARIQAAAEQGEPALMQVRPEISMFLQQHQTDDRLAQVRTWQTQINHQRLQASLERNLGRRSRTAVQDAMREAIRLEKTNPEQSLRILQGVLLAYEHDESNSRRDQECLELARVKISELEQGFDATHETELTRLQRRFQEAMELEPEEAVKVLRGLEMIHQSDSWAQPLLEEIREALALFSDSDDAQAADSAPVANAAP
ncbi:MAG: protein kinase [Planctomycetota bacterium]